MILNLLFLGFALYFAFIIFYHLAKDMIGTPYQWHQITGTAKILFILYTGFFVILGLLCEEAWFNL